MAFPETTYPFASFKRGPRNGATSFCSRRRQVEKTPLAFLASSGRLHLPASMTKGLRFSFSIAFQIIASQIALLLLSTVLAAQTPTQAPPSPTSRMAPPPQPSQADLQNFPPLLLQVGLGRLRRSEEHTSEL